MNKAYITVAELSKICGIPKKELYKALESPKYSSYVVVSDGIKHVSVSIIDQLKNSNGLKEEPKQEKEEQEPQIEINDFTRDKELEALRNEIADLKDIIERKDRQIEEYTMKFAELAGQAQQLASQSQVLQLAEKGVTAEPPQKKGFFKRLFGK